MEALRHVRRDEGLRRGETEAGKGKGQNGTGEGGDQGQVYQETEGKVCVLYINLSVCLLACQSVRVFVTRILSL